MLCMHHQARFMETKVFPITEKIILIIKSHFMVCQKKIGELMSSYYSRMYSMKITSLRFLQFTVHLDALTWQCLNLLIQ